MSKFLAPIHTWLFNKILIVESIEKEIVKELANNEQKIFHNELIQSGFVQEINSKMKYTYALTDQQVHKISIQG
ncbi:MAG: hypothetical protein PHX08_19405 [Lachnospiraceae bacterium]|nr:hypothetical protein [Lachnospiraceae bacterium]